LAQDFVHFGEASFEIVVSDNHSTDDIRAVVESLASPRIRYLRTPDALTMTDSWEFAMAQARGRYVGVVGTDDGYLLHTLSRCHAMLESSGAQAVTFQGACYHWPTSPDISLRNRLLIPRFVFAAGLRDSSTLLSESLRTLHYGLLPCFLNSFVSSELIDEVRARHGRVFDAYCPDVYSGFLVGGSTGRIHVSNEILLVGGVSGSSTGSNAYRNPLSGDWRSELGLTGDTRMQRAAIGFPFVATLIVESAAKALRQLGRGDVLESLEIPSYLRHCYRQAIGIEDAGQRSQAIAAIVAYVREHRGDGVSMLGLWQTRLRWAVQAKVPFRVTRTLQRLRTAAGRGGGVLAHEDVDALALGIHNVFDAAVYLTGLRPGLGAKAAP